MEELYIKTYYNLQRNKFKLRRKSYNIKFSDWIWKITIVSIYAQNNTQIKFCKIFSQFFYFPFLLKLQRKVQYLAPCWSEWLSPHTWIQQLHPIQFSSVYCSHRSVQNGHPREGKHSQYFGIYCMCHCYHFLGGWRYKNPTERIQFIKLIQLLSPSPL